MNKAEITLVLTAGFVIGTVITYRHAAKQYNALADRYNRLLEYERIRKRILDEVMPQLPEDYVLSEKTMTDILAANMFIENDM